MNLPNIAASRSIASKPSVRERPATQILLLIGAGVVLAWLHRVGDLGIGLPGNFGLIWMTVIVLARASSPLRFAAVLTALGYAGGVTGFGGFAAHTLAHAPAYGAAALVIDLAWRLSPTAVRRPPFAGVAGGLAFACKPLVLAGLVAFVDLKAGALRYGLGFPLLTHFCFGATGAVIGALVWQFTGQSERAR